jgi:hypothetical protein
MRCRSAHGKPTRRSGPVQAKSTELEAICGLCVARTAILRRDQRSRRGRPETVTLC